MILRNILFQFFCDITLNHFTKIDLMCFL